MLYFDVFDFRDMPLFLSPCHYFHYAAPVFRHTSYAACRRFSLMSCYMIMPDKEWRALVTEL